jgi:hypothetical protein
VPAESVPDVAPDWYAEPERDRLLDGILEMHPRWYAFFYLTTRLGLRRGEVYAISRDRIREVPPLLVIDRAVQEGYKERRPKLITRKNDRVLTLRPPSDVVDAVRWHIRQGYSGPKFLFSQDGTCRHAARTDTRTRATVRSSDSSRHSRPRRRLTNIGTSP